jgi:predicted HTH domain antitoxin
MTVNVNLEFPSELEARIRQESPHLEADVREAYVLELFRQGRLSHFELSKVLGLDRFETDALLKRRNVFEGGLTMEDLEADRRTLDRVLGEVR